MRYFAWIPEERQGVYDFIRGVTETLKTLHPSTQLQLDNQSCENSSMISNIFGLNVAEDL